MAANQPYLPSRVTQKALLEYVKRTQEMMTTGTSNIRTSLLDKDRIYMREENLTKEQQRAKIANRYGDKSKIQDVAVPIVMPQIESSVAYLASVFCSGYPIFSVASGPDNEDEALMFNSIIAENSIRGAWVREMIMFFRDGLKYNIHALEMDWCEKKVFSVETDPTKSLTSGTAKELMWAGNVMKRMDMYNTVFDPRVEPAQIHIKGDFAGYVDLYTRIGLKSLIQSFPDGFVLPDIINEAFNSAINAIPSDVQTSGFYLPDINPDSMIAFPNVAQAFNWDNWVQNLPQQQQRKINYKNTYEVTKMYVRIIPSDFLMAVAGKKSPQVWKLYIVNGQVLLYAERMTNAHQFLPIIFGQPLEDGLRFNTKSTGDNLAPYQDIAGALWSERIASARRRITDRALYNPNLIRKEDINSPEPNAKIPVKNSAYGKNLSDAIFVWPFNDQAAGLWTQEAQAVVDMSYFASGRNKVSQGQFQKGNKTLHEFDATMSNSNARDQMSAMFMEAQVFTPIKDIIRLNILQYQPTGVVYDYNTQKQIKVDPMILRKKALLFKVSDGLSPQDKMMGTDEFAVALQTMQAMPDIAAGFNIPPLFSYIMKLRGLDGLAKFEKSPLQLQWEQQLQIWQTTAMEAIKKGLQPPPQPTMPPALQQELQQKQASQAAQTDGTATQPNAGTGQQPQQVAGATGTNGMPPGVDVNQGS